jgi:L-ascorbate metabolism protein UlaG (beta-lactamase superfamily)
MQLIGQMNRIDVALLPIGDNFTMGIDDAVKAVEFLKPQVAIPMHYKTFDVIDADPHEFARKAVATGSRIEVLDFGKSFEF